MLHVPSSTPAAEQAATGRKPGLRFAFLSTFYPPYHFGGDAIFLQRLGRSLARRGHSVDVIHDADAYTLLSPRGEPEPANEPQGVRVHRLHSRLGRLSCLATQQTGRPLVHGRRIRRILAAGDFDVVHFHNVSLVGGPGLLAYGDGIKLYTAHEHWLVCPTHVLWRHNRELCTGRQCLRCTLRHRRPPQLWRHTGLLERKARHVDAFISPSAFSAEKHAEFGFSRDMVVLPYFLPEDDPGPQPVGFGPGSPESAPGRTPGRPYFLFVGRLERIKGLQDLIPLFGRSASAELRVVGSGSFEPELRRLAASRTGVRFLGELTPRALRSVYADALALVVPSLCYETFGIVLLEAFREGTPVIARRLGPLTEIVEKSRGGLLFETRDQLAAALRRLATDADLRETLGRSGRQALGKHWSENVALAEYYRLIARLAREKGRTRVAEILEDGA